MLGINNSWTMDLRYRPNDDQLDWIESTWRAWIYRIERIDNIYRLTLYGKTTEAQS